MNASENEKTSRRITIELPVQFIDYFDQLKREWGLRSRGDVIKRLLEEILPETEQQDFIDQISETSQFDKSEKNYKNSIYNENEALVLITPSGLVNTNSSELESESQNNSSSPSVFINDQATKVIDLPGFVSKKTNRLKTSLENINSKDSKDENVINRVSIEHLNQSLKAARDHWLSLYGQNPKDNVIEAAMIWLARDIWPHLDNTEGLTFTWSAANRFVNEYCPEWDVHQPPRLERIIVLSGFLEDPFSSLTLSSRIPTLIRRFVNRFKRSTNVTSFQTLESTMTVHGALKLLELPTTAGASLTLNRIREAYKGKALSVHPDSGGSTEAMRKVNEAYQLLKDLYKKD